MGLNKVVRFLFMHFNLSCNATYMYIILCTVKNGVPHICCWGSLVPRPSHIFNVARRKTKGGPGTQSHVMEREGPEHLAGQRSLGL